MAKRRNVSIRVLRRRGGVRWIVDRFEAGKRRRTIYTTKREAEAEAGRLREQANQVGSVWLGLAAEERDELLKFRQGCVDRGVRAWDLLKAYDTREIHVATASPTLREVIDELIVAKTGAGRSKRYTDILQLILDEFAKGRESQRIAGITVADVDRWLDGKNLAGRPTFKARLATLNGLTRGRSAR